MASRYLRFSITIKNGKTYGINALSEKQAMFFFRDMCKANEITSFGAYISDVGGYYPGDVFSVWSVENKQFHDVVA